MLKKKAMRKNSYFFLKMILFFSEKTFSPAKRKTAETTMRILRKFSRKRKQIGRNLSKKPMKSGGGKGKLAQECDL